MTGLTKNISRRDFLKGGIASGVITLSGCATFDPRNPPKSAEEFNVKNFDRWFRRNKLYRSPHPTFPEKRTFYDSIVQGWTPGVDWIVAQGTKMVAVAPGQVTEIGDIRLQGHAGGYFVLVENFGNFGSGYAHLNTIQVKLWQGVKRGDTIGTAGSPVTFGIAKLIFYLTSSSGAGYQACPNRYGYGHSYMQTNKIDRDKEDLGDRQTLDNKTSKKREKQIEIIKEFDLRRINREQDPLFEKIHIKGYYGRCAWSPPEMFDYLHTMHEVAEILFPKLNREQIEAMKKEFLENQPIILTLPFKKV